MKIIWVSYHFSWFQLHNFYDNVSCKVMHLSFAYWWKLILKLFISDVMVTKLKLIELSNVKTILSGGVAILDLDMFILSNHIMQYNLSTKLIRSLIPSVTSKANVLIFNFTEQLKCFFGIGSLVFWVTLGYTRRAANFFSLD